MALTSLPPEVILLIVSHLPIQSVAIFPLLCKYFKSVLDSPLVYENVALRYGYLDEPPSSGSGISLTYGSTSQRHETEAVERAIVIQEAMQPSLYQGCKTWKDLVRVRYLLDKNWESGQYTTFLACKLNLGPRSNEDDFSLGIWRFKLDTWTGTGAWMTSGITGGHQLWSFEGNLLWQTSLPAHNYPHVELSGGCCFLFTDEDIFVYRKASLNAPSSLSVQDINRIDAERRRHSNSLIYQPFSKLKHNFPIAEITATKARFPLYAAYRRDTGYVWNIETGELKASIDLSCRDDNNDLVFYDPHTYYIELDERYLIVAGEFSISFWSHSGDNKKPRRFPEDYIDPMENLIYPNSYIAVHHGHNGKNLVAASSNGVIVWVMNYWDMLDGNVDQEDTTCLVRLKLDTGQMTIEQLAVEGNRVVFVAQEGFCRYSLYLINLPKVETVEEVKKNPPKLTCLSRSLPTLTAPSRVEMSSDGIFVPGMSALLPGGFLYDISQQSIPPPAVTVEWYTETSTFHTESTSRSVSRLKEYFDQEIQYEEKLKEAMGLPGALEMARKDTVVGFAFNAQT